MPRPKKAQSGNLTYYSQPCHYACCRCHAAQRSQMLRRTYGPVHSSRPLNRNDVVVTMYLKHARYLTCNSAAGDCLSRAYLELKSGLLYHSKSRSRARHERHRCFILKARLWRGRHSYVLNFNTMLLRFQSGRSNQDPATPTSTAKARRLRCDERASSLPQNQASSMPVPHHTAQTELWKHITTSINKLDPIQPITKPP